MVKEADLKMLRGDDRYFGLTPIKGGTPQLLTENDKVVFGIFNDDKSLLYGYKATAADQNEETGIIAIGIPASATENLIINGVKRFRWEAEMYIYSLNRYITPWGINKSIDIYEDYITPEIRAEIGGDDNE